MFQSTLKRLAEAITLGSVDDFDRVRRVHDWIILNTAYDLDAVKSRDPADPAYRESGVIQDGSAVCLGYARAAERLLKAVGVACEVVSNSDHAWNMVQVAGTWFHMDVTHDDPTPDELGRVCWDHFLVSTDLLAKTHAMPSTLPRAPRDYFRGLSEWQRTPLAHTLGEVSAITARLRSAGAEHIRVFGWRLAAAEMTSAVMSALGPVERPSKVQTRGSNLVMVELVPAEQVSSSGPAKGRLVLSSQGSEFIIEPRDGGLVLDAATVARAFPSVRDNTGKAFAAHFAEDGGGLIRYSRAWRWYLSSAATSGSYWMVNGERVAASPRKLRPGDRLVLWSAVAKRELTETAIVVSSS